MQTPIAAARQSPSCDGKRGFDGFDCGAHLEQLMLFTTSSEGFVWPQSMSNKGRKQQPQEHLPSNKVKDSVYENIDAVDLT